MKRRESELTLRARRGVYGLRRLCNAYFSQDDPPSVLQFFASNLVDRATRQRSFAQLSRVEAERDHATAEKAALIRDQLREVPLCASRWEVLDIALRQVSVDGLYAEFGVADGESLRYLCERVPGPVYGFDSFRGLPEGWGSGMWPGTFARPHGAPPGLPPNAVVVPGYFEESLPRFLQGLGARSVAFLHMDADLYSSTSTVLSALRERIIPSTVLVFDEYFGYVGWKSGGEYRAFNEFVQNSGYRYEFLACNAAGSQVAMRILPKPSESAPSTAVH
jgi:hypothetical protein